MHIYSRWEGLQMSNNSILDLLEWGLRQDSNAGGHHMHVITAAFNMAPWVTVILSVDIMSASSYWCWICYFWISDEGRFHISPLSLSQRSNHRTECCTAPCRLVPSCKEKGNCLLNQPFFISVLGEWTYYMYGRLNSWNKLVKNPKTHCSNHLSTFSSMPYISSSTIYITLIAAITFPPFPPCLTFPHPHTNFCIFDWLYMFPIAIWVCNGRLWRQKD